MRVVCAEAAGKRHHGTVQRLIEVQRVIDLERDQRTIAHVVCEAAGSRGFRARLVRAPDTALATRKR